MSSINSTKSGERHQPDLLKGFAAGAIGGAVASWVMDEFQFAWFKMSRLMNEASESNNTKQSQSDDEEPSTVKAAEIISEKVFNHQLAKSEKHVAGAAVHYATGATSGAVYGVAAELAQEVTTGRGIPFGTALWLVVDEGAVPLLGLSKGPTSYPLSTHLYALASHFVYGMTTEIVRRGLRKTILS